MTSKLEQAKALTALALDGGRTAPERLEALQGAQALRRELKVGWAKLDAPGMNYADLAADLEANALADGGEGEHPEPESPGYIDPETGDDVQSPESREAESKKKAAEETPDAPRAERGGIGRLVNELLTETDLEYAEIVARVKAAFPEARTTARSIASVAADLRRDGVEVATRRRAKRAAPASE